MIDGKIGDIERELYEQHDGAGDDGDHIRETIDQVDLHPAQTMVFEDLFEKRACRHAVVVASRGFGKSFLAGVAAVSAVFELMELHKSVPHKDVHVIAPTYDQVVDIYYPLINYELGMEDYAQKSSKDSGTFWFENNVTLHLVSYEAVERMRGKGSYFAVLDEPSSWVKGVGLKEAWESIIEPCLSTRWSPKRARKFGARSPGRSLTIGTPKGFNYFYDMHNFREIDSLWKSYHFDYRESPILDEEEIERIKARIDPLKFNREYLAQFLGSGNNVFYCFDRRLHVTPDVPEFAEKEDVLAAIDFNVGVMATSLWADRGGQMHCIDEFMGHPDTEELAKALVAKYVAKGHRVIAFPDPTGKSRKTSAPVGRTDFSILQAAGIPVLARPASPPIADSVNAVNRKLKNANGQIEVFVHPRCKGMVESFEKTVWVENNPDLAHIDKKDGVEHFSDGARYMFEFKYPAYTGTSRVARGEKF
jgi:hypothetical protein